MDDPVTQIVCTEADLKNLLMFIPGLADKKIMATAWR